VIPAIPSACALLVLALCSACHVVESKDWNLEQLHEAGGRHRYTAALEGDFEFFMRQRVAAPLLSAGSTLAVKTPKSVEAPADECLDNLIELEEFDPADPRVAGLQVEWYARLAVDDPWRLSRERALLALGRAGQRLGAGLPDALKPGEQPTGPEALSSALASLVKSARPVMERGKRAGETAELDLDASCQLIERMTLDIAGARRALRATVDLTRASGLNSPAAVPLGRLNASLQRVCVRRALAAGLVDKEDVVRAAAIEASVACAGNAVLLPILQQLGHEPSADVIVRVMKLVRDVGLPEPSDSLAPEEREKARNAWLAELVRVLETRTEGDIRVGTMLALAKVSGANMQSLREEDWHAWWAARQAGAVAPQRPPAGGRPF
jgi:hypothetical protein